MSRFEEGAVIADRYEVRGRLGIGGFAEVYEAWDSTLDRRVAVKLMLTADLTDDEEEQNDFIERFRREATLAARVEHPNVVQIYDVGKLAESHDPYIVMEYLNGYDLDVQLKKHGPIEPKRALRLFKEALLALALAHESGIVHKDLKPSNLFLTRPGTAFERMNILDFGVAHLEHAVQGRLTREGQVVGTPSYLSPEYATERIVKPALDVYQMGLILVEALTCRVVVDHMDPVSTMFAHVRGDLDIPEAISNSPLGPVLTTALALDHEERFQNAMAFYTALAPISADGIPDFSGSGVRKGDGTASGPLVNEPNAISGNSPQTGRHDAQSDSGEQGTLLMYQDASGEHEDAKAAAEPAPKETRVALKSREEAAEDTAAAEESGEVAAVEDADEPARTVIRGGKTAAMVSAGAEDEFDFQTNKKPLWIAAIAGFMLLGGGTFMFLQDSGEPVEEAAAVEKVAEEPKSQPDPVAAIEVVEKAEEPEPEIVKVILSSEPEKASVYEGERLVGLTPLEIDFFSANDAPRRFKFQRRGFESSTKAVAPDDGPEVVVKLAKLPQKEPEVAAKREKPKPVREKVEKKEVERPKPAVKKPEEKNMILLP